MDLIIIRIITQQLKRLNYTFEKVSNFCNPHPIGNLEDFTLEEIEEIKKNYPHIFGND